jgi:ATP-dependent DNA helicase PIF1
MEYSKGQQSFLFRVLAGENIFLTGKAGTGKSTIVRKAISKLQSQGRNIVALAPTGIAANNIGGQTLHSFFNLNPFGVLNYKECNFLKGEKRSLIDRIDTIFIDEVSMLRPDLFDAINWTLLKNGCKSIKEIQFILIGDLKQLPAPIDDNMRSVLYQTYLGEEFYHAAVFEKLNFQFIELDEVLRQNNEDFISALNAIREGQKHEYFRQFANKETKGIILAPHNATVARYNKEGLDALPGFEHVFTASIEGNVKADDFNLETVVRVKDGAKIMYLANSRNNNLINGTLGTFKSYGDNYFIVVNGVEYALDRIKCTKKQYVLNEKQDKLELEEIGSITQYPIKLAYALTIHKAQGLTFSECTIDLSRPCFQKGQMYTALSRVTSPDGLSIITK